MKAIYNRELDSQFNGLTGYVYCAFVLLVSALFIALITLQGEPRFEAIFYYMRLYFVPVITIPILTMRSIAEERHQKTDQLLYSLPLSMTKIVLGKFMAIVVVMALPLLVMAIYPPLLTKLATAGSVPYAAAYGSLGLYFLMCAAFAAICLFLSSLTEHVAMAAGLSVVAGLALYFSAFLESYVSATALASFLVLTVLAVLLALVFWLMTKNGGFAAVVLVVLVGALVLVYCLSPDSFTGLSASIVGALNLFGHFDDIASGLLSLKAVVYYLSVIALFLFLTVQSMEKRRWS